MKTFLFIVAALAGALLWRSHQAQYNLAHPERQHAAPGYCVQIDAAGTYWLASAQHKGVVYDHFGTFKTPLDAIRRSWSAYDFATNYTPEVLPQPVGKLVDFDCTKGN